MNFKVGREESHSKAFVIFNVLIQAITIGSCSFLFHNAADWGTLLDTDIRGFQSAWLLMTSTLLLKIVQVMISLISNDKYPHIASSTIADPD